MDMLVIDEANKLARKHNRRSEDMVFFEHDRYAKLDRLTESTNAKSYTPGSNYSFVHRRGSKPREVFAAEPELKTVMAFLMERIDPLLEARLSPYTYNNRAGMGTQAAVNKVIENMYACSHGYTRPAWIIKYDFRGYFPNFNQDKVYAQFRSLIDEYYRGSDKDDVLYALQVACFCNPERSMRKSPIWDWHDIPAYKSVYTKDPGTGGLIGYQFYQSASSFYPVKIDEFIVENVTPYYVRFVDDSVLLTDNKEMVLAMMPAIRKMCAELDITLHPRKFYCQPVEHGLEFLGYHILPGRVHISRRIVNRALEVARNKERGGRNYMDSINSYLGMIKGTSDLRLAKAVLDAVSRPGFSKDYYNYKITINKA